MDLDEARDGGALPANRLAPPAGGPRPVKAGVVVPRPAPRRRLPVKRIVLALLLVAAGAYGGRWGYHWWTDGRFLVSTDDAYVQGDITVLAANAEGYVTAVAVENGQTVRAGDVIARIDDGDYRLALQAAENRLATQQSTIERIERQVDAARAGIARAEASVDAARAELTHAQAEFERQTQLSRTEFTSRSRLDEATWDRARASAAVRAAEAELATEQANVEVLRAQRSEAERVAGELRTAVAKAERDLSFTTVHAPVDGVIGNKVVQIGSYVEADTRLAALVPLVTVHVDANFKETQLAHIRPGQSVRIAIDAFPDRTIAGTVESIAPASGAVFSLLPPENATGNFTKIVQRVPVRIAVDPTVLAEGLLRPGLSIVASVDTRTGPPERVAAGP